MSNDDVPAAEESERSPLLPETSTKLASESKHTREVTAILIITLFFICTGTGLMVVPQYQIVEDILCYKYYEDKIDASNWPNNGFDKKLCKGDEIQSELSYIYGILSMLESVPGLLLAIPYGLLSDRQVLRDLINRIGRKPVLWMSVGGLALGLIWNAAVLWFWKIFPVSLLWLAPLFSILGGGDRVLNLIVYTLVADIALESERAISFFYFAVSVLMADVISTPIASQLMTYSPWLAFFLGYAIFALGIIPVFFIPETLHMARRQMTNQTAQQSESTSEVENDGRHINTQKLWPTIISNLRQGVSEMGHSASMLKSIPMALLLFTFLVHGFNITVPKFSIQYLSKRFDWSMARVGYLLSVRAILNIFLLLVLLPVASNILSSPRLPFRYSVLHRDLFLARVSAIFLILGTFFVAGPSIYVATFGLMVYTLGTGFATFCRSVITSLVDQEHRGRLYALISVVDTTGMLTAGPVIAWLFRVGLKLKGDWVGLPYLFITFMFVIVGIVVYIVRPVARLDNSEEPVEVDFEE